MICFAGITPHPPIMVSGVGHGEDLVTVSGSIKAMEELGGRMKKSKPDTVVLISPHAPSDPDAFGINVSEKLKGNLMMFGLNKSWEFEKNAEFAEKLHEACDKAGLPTRGYESELDHGALVPLSFLTEAIQPKLVPLAFSYMDFKTHYQFGEVFGRVCADAPERVAIVASGDLSHRLIPGAPAGYTPKGKDFDKQLIDYLQAGKTEDIINFDPYFIEEIGECGLRSFLILLGALRGKYDFELLHYEGPFGVGYLTAQLTQKK